ATEEDPRVAAGARHASRSASPSARGNAARRMPPPPRRGVAVSLPGLVVALVLAGSAGAPGARSLDAAMHAAEENAPSLRVARQETRIRAAEELLAVGALFPVFFAQGTYERNQFEQTVILPQPGEDPLAATLQLLDEGRASFGVRLPLVDAAG